MTQGKTIRVLLAKPGLDGHDVGAKIVARSLMDAGFEVRNEREVLVLDIEDRPGVLGKITRGIANAGVNTDLSYITASGQLILGVDDIDKARATV